VDKDLATFFDHPFDPQLYVRDELTWALCLYPDRFAPHIVLTQVTEGHGSTGHAMDEYGCLAPPGSICVANATLKISNGETTWIYIIKEYDMCLNAWKAEWPD
jgi:hypothetical protein